MRHGIVELRLQVIASSCSDSCLHAYSRPYETSREPTDCIESNILALRLLRSTLSNLPRTLLTSSSHDRGSSSRPKFSACSVQASTRMVPKRKSRLCICLHQEPQGRRREMRSARAKRESIRPYCRHQRIADNLNLAYTQLSLNVKLPTGAEAVFDLDPLARSVDPKTYVCKTMSTKVEIKLPKAQPGVKWNSLEGDEESTTATSMRMSVLYHLCFRANGDDRTRL